MQGVLGATLHVAGEIGAMTRQARRSAPAARRARRSRAHRARSVPGALGLTLVGALIPGLGFILAGRAKLGAFVLTVTATLVGLGIAIGLTRREQVLAVAVNPDELLVVAGVVLFLAICWIWVIISSHRLLRPAATSTAGRAFGSAFVGLICFAIAAPMAMGAQSVMAQRDLVSSVFASEGSSKSATRPKVENKKDPWATTPRLNLLLLGADDGAGRDGTRTDTVIVASIDTKTGDTALMTFPRNTIKMPFPQDSPLHRVYPDGYWQPGLSTMSSEAQNYYLDAMYRFVPAEHGELIGESDNKGADVLKLSVGAATGLKIHYYMQVNLKGFEMMVNALGGITVNVNYRIPVGGDDNGTIGYTGDDRLPGRYLEPGPNKHLQGFDALWFARGRYNVAGADHARQVRQRCTIKALVDAADPGTVVTNYQQIAKAGKNLLRTDIPQELLPAFVDLALKVKQGEVTNIDIKDDLKYGHPDFDAVRATIKKELAAAANGKPTVTPTNPVSPASPSRKPTTPVVTDECAYNPSPE